MVISECVFGQTNDGDDTSYHPPYGASDGTDAGVWFKYIPSVTETGVVIATDQTSADPSLGAFPSYFTEYDTVLAVYDSTMTLIAADDDGGVGDLSTVTVDVTGGETYYIQVVGYGGDEGRLLLTIDCTGGITTTAADIWGWGGENGEGWHIVLGVPPG